MAFICTATPSFPVNTYQRGNYWVDAIFNGVVNVPVDTTFAMLVTSPASGATAVPVNSKIFLFFNKFVDASSVSNNSVILQTDQTPLHQQYIIRETAV